MKQEDWINKMIETIESNTEKKEDSQVQLSDSDIQRVADMMIKRMSESDITNEPKDPKETDIQDPNNPQPELLPGETLID